MCSPIELSEQVEVCPAEDVDEVTFLSPDSGGNGVTVAVLEISMADELLTLPLSVASVSSLVLFDNEQ